MSLKKLLIIVSLVSGTNSFSQNNFSVLINELMISPTANDGSMSGDGGISAGRGEWIELYNPNLCEPVDISCYYLGNSTGEGSGGYVIPAGTIIPPAGFCMVRGSNMTAVPANLLVENGGNVVELVVPTDITDNGVCSNGTRLWFPNAGGWIAFYDANGVPQDAVSWVTSSTNTSGSACVAALGGCNAVGSLDSYDNIPTNRKNWISSQNASNHVGQSLRRTIDGGAWPTNLDVAYGAPTFATCNGACVSSTETATFTQIGPYQYGVSIPELPTTSLNGISGTWFPAINNLLTTTYTFTPSAGQCGIGTTMTIAIIEPLNYSLSASDSAICSGSNVNLSVNLTGTYRAGSVFCNGLPTSVVDVTNATTGKIWMDRNLGASQVATSVTDVNAYGDLYQWGRGSDGHQCRNSATTSALSSSDQPANADFILSSVSPYNWLVAENTNLWQGVNGVNNPCPFGYRLPTESELNEERLSWWMQGANGAFASPLKFTLAVMRSGLNGQIFNFGSPGYYWTSSLNGANSVILKFTSTTATMQNSERAAGFSVRCIKDLP
jgi:uncharacterized protein (TIGR02145 family)